MIVGDKLTTTVTVTESQTIKALDPDCLPVLSTSALTAIMENAAMQCSIPALHEGQTSIGTETSFTQSKAVKAGSIIETTAELIDVKGHKGRMMIFYIQSTVNGEEIAEGFHVRYIVEIEYFAPLINKQDER